MKACFKTFFKVKKKDCDINFDYLLAWLGHEAVNEKGAINQDEVKCVK